MSDRNITTLIISIAAALTIGITAATSLSALFKNIAVALPF